MAMMALPCNTLLRCAIYWYWGGLERVGFSLPSKIELHPVTFAHFDNISCSFQN
jgi:hypothetical protein